MGTEADCLGGRNIMLILKRLVINMYTCDRSVAVLKSSALNGTAEKLYLKGCYLITHASSQGIKRKNELCDV